MTREITISDDLRDLLIQIRRQSWRAVHSGADSDRDLWLWRLGQPTVEPAELLAEIEEELDAALPDPILAVLCAHVPILEKWRGVTLRTLPEFANQAWSGFRIERDLVAFGEGPIAWDQGRFCTWHKASTDDDPEIFVLNCHVDRFPEVERMRLSAWLRVQVHEGLGDLGDNPVAADPDGLAPFRPALVVPPPQAVRRVRHASFGEGSVLETRGDRLTIEFDEVGRKRLLRRHIEFID